MDWVVFMSQIFFTIDYSEATFTNYKNDLKLLVKTEIKDSQDNF